jgi:D-sedoheptulose 7-phosphate isomerase
LSIFISNVKSLREVLVQVESLGNNVLIAGAMASNVLRSGGKILFCGNGGSAADCQHLAAELTGRFINDRRPLAAAALTTDTSALTCIGNDYSFEEIFARQVTGFGRPGDLLIGISTSGNSRNVIRAVEDAKKIGIRTIGFLGRDGGQLKNLCEHNIIVPSNVTARIQECHILIGHTLCGLIEQELGLS